MATTGTSLTASFDIAGNPTSTTASVAPTANHLILVDVFTVFNGAGGAADPTLSGAGMTWTKVISSNDTTAGINLIRFRALSASPGSGVLTITHAATIFFAGWSVKDHDGVDTGGTNGADAVVQSAVNKDVTGTVSTLTATLGAFGSVNNGACSAFGFFNASAVPTGTPDTGWTELDDQGSLFGGFAGAIETQFIASNDTTAVITWSGTGAIMALSSELKAASSALTAAQEAGIWAAMQSSGVIGRVDA